MTRPLSKADIEDMFPPFCPDKNEYPLETSFDQTNTKTKQTKTTLSKYAYAIFEKSG